jgi:hypothetical protein
VQRLGKSAGHIDFQSAGVFRRIDVTITGCEIPVTPAILIKEELSNLIDEKKPDYYIVPSFEVANSIKEGHKKWLIEPSKSGKAHNENPMRKFGIDKDLEKYKDRWDNLKLL